MNKREVLYSLLSPTTKTPYIPAAFFMHFDPKDHHGQASVDKHLEYFDYTGMDLVKIQYEKVFPHRPEIVSPVDWERMPRYGEEFYADHWQIVEKIVAAKKKEAPIVMTLYSPFMCAGHSITDELLVKHLREDPEKTKKGLEIITDSLMLFVQGCIERGVDGFYHSTQGGENYRFEGSPIFEQYIKPYDLALMNEINAKSDFNILHVCDYCGEYSTMDAYLDYPGDIVSSPLMLGGERLAPQKAAEIFQRPIMGGLDRHGLLAHGSKEEIVTAVNALCETAPENFILGADCTLPGDTDWENLKIAIDAAHNYQR